MPLAQPTTSSVSGRHPAAAHVSPLARPPACHAAPASTARFAGWPAPAGQPARGQPHRAGAQCTCRAVGVITSAVSRLPPEPATSAPSTSGSVQRTERDAHKTASALCRVLGITEQQLMLMVQRCPALFCFSPEAMAASVEAIAFLTGLQASQVPQLLAADPSLLLQPDNLKRNLLQVAQALGIPPQEVVALAAREPQVLALTGCQAEARVGALATVLHTTPRRVVECLMLGPGLLILEAEEVGARVKALQIFLSAGVELVAPLVLVKPALLDTPPQLLAGRVQHLAEASGLDAQTVLSRAADGPELVASNSCFFDRRCRELAAGLGCEERHVARMLVLTPRLLSQPAGTLFAKWQVLLAITAGHEGWTQRLRGVNACERGKLLSASYVTMARLRYLADHKLQCECDMVAAMSASEAHFSLQYPGFREWLRS